MRKTTNKLFCLLLSLLLAVSLAACDGAADSSSAAGDSPPESSSSEVSSESSIEPSSGDDANSLPDAVDSVTVTDQAGRQVVIEGAVEKSSADITFPHPPVLRWA